MKKTVKNTNIMVASNETVMIKLKDLFLSEFNVRNVPATKEDDKLLYSSIKAHGVKQNLVVVSQGSKKDVIAGGRRYKQLLILLKEGYITENYLVPCMIESKDNISAISLSENIKASMHPADEFAAFQSMIEEGKTIVDISNEFGVSQAMVKKRLKMAGVNSQLLHFYRAGKLNLDHIMAFTISDDHDRQMACYKHVSNGFIHANLIKNFLLDTALITSHGMVKLVTLKAYKKAGGTTIADLFESKIFINDRELLEFLALEILNKEAKAYKKQWKWVEVSLSSFDDYAAKLSAEFKDVPKSLVQELQRKAKALDELNDKDYETWTDADDEMEAELEKSIEILEDKRERYRNYSDEQKAVSGVVIGFDSEGEITVHLGYVKKEDMKLAFPPANKTNKGGAGEPSADAIPQSIESLSLKNDLEHYRLQALQSEIMTDDKLAYDLMVFTLASAVLGEEYSFSLPLDLSVTPYNFSSTQDIYETEPSKRVERFNDSLEMAWHAHELEGDRFSAFRELTVTQKKRILSYCAAVSYRSSVSESLDKVVTDTVKFDIAQHWKPTKENYFSRIKKDDLLEIGAKAIDEQWVDDNAKLPKGQIADKLDCAESMENWMPDSMQ